MFKLKLCREETYIDHDDHPQNGPNFGKAHHAFSTQPFFFYYLVILFIKFSC